MKKIISKSISGMIILFVLFLLFRFQGYDLNNLAGQAVKTNDKAIDSFVKDQGNISLYFCPQEGCEEAMLSMLDSAERSIHCAFFELDLEKLQQKILMKKQNNLDVKIVTDDQYLDEFNYPFVRSDTYGLMHDKFCIIDGKTISSGSMNPTNNDAFKNNNNLLIIDSPLLADNYEEEFSEMWNGKFKSGQRVKNQNIIINNTRIKNLFCPDDDCAYQVKEELKKAKKSIYFMTFSFTDAGIANIILLQNLDNLTIKGVMEARQISRYSQYARLKENGIDVIKDGNSNNLHHKVFIIDEKTVITGSFNPTEGGDKRNDENVLIMTDQKIASRFLEEFRKVYRKAEIKNTAATDER